LKFLIDTNVFIPLEPTQLGDVEPGTELASQFARTAVEGSHQIYVHPAAQADIRRDQQDSRRELRQLLFQKYPPLPDPPDIPTSLESLLGPAETGTNNWVDHQHLAAIHADAVDFLVTEDRKLHGKAARLGLQGRVVTVAGAIALLRDLFDTIPPPPPAVRNVKAHALNEQDPIWESFRLDYGQQVFDEWLRECKRGHREAFVIDGGQDALAGVAIIKSEDEGEYGLEGKVLKICSFKVSADFSGFRYGELLLKTIFQHAFKNDYDCLYVTVFEKHGLLISLFEDFGFQRTAEQSRLGEVVLIKHQKSEQPLPDGLGPLDYHVRYGPFTCRLTGHPTYVVPILPQYHRLLFPETETQQELFPGTMPFGNSIRKAYLCHAGIRKLKPGDSLVFYRSETAQGILCTGVVEGTLVSSDATEIARYVGKRTVYSFDEILALTEKTVLAILFRQARTSPRLIPPRELASNGVFVRPPQTIARVPEEACDWLQQQIAR